MNRVYLVAVAESEMAAKVSFVMEQVQKAGKKAAAGFFVGQVMKLSKGKADPKIVGPIVARKLAAC